MYTPKDIIEFYHIKPRKKLSQSFLIDQNILKKIAAAARMNKEDIVVEIGAGIGVLTQMLAEKAQKVIAVELDKDLVEVLKKRLADYDNVEVNFSDILNFDFSSISNKYNCKVKVVGNVPYNISSPLIFHLLSNREAIGDFILMLQKEVTQRLIAQPGNKNYGVPSVILQMYAYMEKISDVPADCFYPRPKVESAVLRGTFLEKPFIKLVNEAFFSQLVKASFAQRRKMLINNLRNSKLYRDIKEEKLNDILVSAGINSRRRGETLSVAEFGKLSNFLWIVKAGI